MKMKNTANKGAEWYAERIACLAEFTTSERYEVLRRTVAMRTRYMTVLAENMYHGQNAAALIRHCEAFGVQEMHTVETLCRFEPNPDIVRGTDQWVDVRRHPSTGEALAALRRAGYRIVATTPHREDVTPETFDVAAGPFALVFGTEHAGISDEVIAGASFAVVSTGGGLPTWRDNMPCMNAVGHTVYLRRSPEQIARRLSPYGRRKRPRLQGLDDEQLVAFMRGDMAAREPFYAQASLVVDCDPMSDDELVEHIVQTFSDRG